MLGSVCVRFYCCVTVNSFSISYLRTPLIEAPSSRECKLCNAVCTIKGHWAEYAQRRYHIDRYNFKDLARLLTGNE